MDKITVVIINYNTSQHLAACLATIAPAIPTIVVDNASNDDSRQMVQARFPWVTLLANEDNPGYGAAANQGIKATTTPYVLLLNSDTRLEPNTPQATADFLATNRQTAVLGPRLHNPNGSLQPSCFHPPTPWYTLLKESSLGSIWQKLPGGKNRYLPLWPHDEVRHVPWVLGAALGIRKRPFLDHGGFDPDFFMYFEEVDLCHRLSQAGWQITFAPVTTIIHEGGGSTRLNRGAMAIQLQQSLLQFGGKHFSRWQQFWLRQVLAYLMRRNLLRDQQRQKQGNHTADLAEDVRVWQEILQSL